MGHKIPKILLMGFMLPLLGAGCISFGGTSANGGIFFSTNRGDAWEQRGAIPSASGAARSLANFDIRFMTQDTRDLRALYVGTETNGAYYSWDGGALWQPLGKPFERARVDAIALHPGDRCTFYVAAGSKIFQSSDCGRQWTSSDFDVAVTALAIDARNPAVLYAGSAMGDIMKSSDGSRSWRALTRAGQPIMSIAILPFADSTAVVAATKKGGLFRSTDGGSTWESLKKAMADYRSAYEFRALAVAPKTPGVLFHASKYGILRSADLGTTWDAVTLLTEPGTVDIRALAVDSNSSQSMMYATTSTFYRSSDTGNSWESKKLPTARQPTVLLIDARDGSAVWLGTKRVKK